ncbi:MAG TPA: HAD family hydrolase [Desulfuromonadaceae bacterium]
MPQPPAHPIRAIVFDLDGTLYVSQPFAATIQEEAAVYLAAVRGIGPDEARELIDATRARLTGESGTVQTLSAVCTALGGSVRDLHAWFEQRLRPEAYLVRDERVVNLLARLGERFGLYLYTNNNRALTMRILEYLGLEGLFSRVFTIDDAWRAKPDEVMLERILAAIGRTPAEVLFVGDRYDVDLRLPEQKGCPVFLCRNVEQLLRLDEVLT